MFYLLDIDQHPWVLLKIDDIGRRCNKPSLSKDIQKACQSERAFLFVNCRSFFILKPDLYPDEKRLLIWVAYTKEKNGSARYYPFIERVARQVGGRTLYFFTKRKGFNRTIPRLGYNNAGTEDGYTIWEKVL